MKNPAATDQLSSAGAFATEQGRQRVVQAALNLTQNSAIAPGPLERELLDQFVQGALTLDEVLDRLEAE